MTKPAAKPMGHKGIRLHAAIDHIHVIRRQANAMAEAGEPLTDDFSASLDCACTELCSAAQDIAGSLGYELAWPGGK